MRILVVGFPRSGTSLTYRIFEKHPEVQRMFFEKWIIKKSKTKKEFYNRFPMFRNEKLTYGEKVICEKRVTGKIGKTSQTIVDYCLRWNDWFGKNARIVQIVRYPIDALNSLVVSKKKFPRGPGFGTIYKEYLKYIPTYLFEISKIENCMTIKYENLLEEPKKIIRELYTHCDLNPNFEFKERIKKEKAFRYFHKHKKMFFEYDNRLEEAIEILKKKVSGWSYPSS